MSNHTQRRNHALAFGLFLNKQDDGSGGAPATLAEAREALKEANAELEKARSEKDTAVSAKATAEKAATEAQAEVKNLQGQFDAATQAAEKAKSEAATAQAEVTRLTGELTIATNNLAKANTNVGRLERLCGVMGVDTATAVNQEPPPAAKASVADYETRMAAAKTPAEKAKITQELEKAYAEGRLA